MSISDLVIFVVVVVVLVLVYPVVVVNVVVIVVVTIIIIIAVDIIIVLSWCNDPICRSRSMGSEWITFELAFNYYQHFIN